MHDTASTITPSETTSGGSSSDLGLHRLVILRLASKGLDVDGIQRAWPECPSRPSREAIAVVYNAHADRIAEMRQVWARGLT